MQRRPLGAPSDLAAFSLDSVVPADNEERLLLALADSIRDKGLRGVQITDVVGRAGASRSTFYRCFTDKDAAVVALAEMVFRLSVDCVAGAIDMSAPPGTRIDQGIEAFLSFVAADPVLITAIRTELPTIGPVGVATHLDSVDQFAELMATSLREPGSDDDNLTHTVVMLVTGLDGAFARALSRGEAILDIAPAAKLLFRRAMNVGDV